MVYSLSNHGSAYLKGVVKTSDFFFFENVKGMIFHIKPKSNKLELLRELVV